MEQMEKVNLQTLHSIMGIHSQDKITNTEILNWAESVPIEVTLLKTCLRWSDHVIRMEDNHMPKQSLFWELEQGHRNQGQTVN